MKAAATWSISIIDSDTVTLLLRGSSETEGEIYEVAAEARRLRPQSKIVVTTSTGGPVIFK